MDGFLDKIQTSKDIRRLDKKALESLCKELRRFVIRSVSKTGGHLASNLGVVELTVALTYCFQFPKDKIVWDVGHQAYIYKALTGRKERFETLRQLDGLSGFPKPNESAYDAFATGHSSTSISAALGIAKARDLQGKDNRVIAVIGDGSLTGGLAYEALNHLGRENTDCIVILNDNEMSIDRNVGALSKHLNSARVSDSYVSLKESMKRFRDNVPVLGEGTYRVLEKVRDGAKAVLLENTFFEQLGFKYFGPIDGHDLEGMIEIFQNVKRFRGPVLIHVKTKKGRGYLPAEKEPERFHGIGAFDMKTGKSVAGSKEATWSDVFGRKIVELGRENPNVVGITAAMTGGTGFDKFRREFPERFFDVAIAEQHATTFAAGLASQGIVPVFAVYSSFLQRAYDQIIHDVCMENHHVVFAIDRAGIVGSDGETHQGVFDLSYLGHIPNMTLLSPKNAYELEAMLDYAVNECTGPVAIRYSRGIASVADGEKEVPIVYGKSECIQDGERVAILAEGHMLDAVFDAAHMLKENGIMPFVVNMRFISPIDKEMLRAVAKKCSYVFTVEDNVKKGGFGSRVLEAYSELGLAVQVINLGFPDCYIEQGTQAELFKRYRLDKAGIYQQIMDKIED